MHRSPIDTDEVVRLYVEEGLRGQAIADRLGCSPGIVYARLAAAGVERSRKARLDRDDVIRRYLGGESALAIGRSCGVSGPTVIRHLRGWGVALRTHAESLQPVGRAPCPRSGPFRAYLLGFVWGDLAVDPPDGKGSTVALRGSTTSDAQVGLVRSLLSPYGRVAVTPTAWGCSLRASLDDSFGFLLDKYGEAVPAWVVGPAAEAAFAAGYIDAEGSFGVYDGRARFKLDSCDVPVQDWFVAWLGSIGVHAVARLVERAGVRASGVPLNADLYRINVNEALSLSRLTATIEPFSRHAQRRATMAAASQNVIDRMRARAAA